MDAAAILGIFGSERKFHVHRIALFSLWPTSWVVSTFQPRSVMFDYRGFFGLRSSSIYRIALIWLWPLFLLVSTPLNPRSVIFDFRGIFRAGGIIAAVQLSELEECFNTNPSQKHCSWTVKLIWWMFFVPHKHLWVNHKNVPAMRQHAFPWSSHTKPSVAQLLVGHHSIAGMQ